MVLVTRPLSKKQSFRICQARVAVQWGNTKSAIFTMDSMANRTGSMALKLPTQMLLKEPWYCMGAVLYPTRKSLQSRSAIVWVVPWFQKSFLQNFRLSLTGQPNQYSCGCINKRVTVGLSCGQTVDDAIIDH